MIEMLRDFVDKFQRRSTGYQGWFVSPDGAVLCTADLKSEEFKQQYGEFLSLVFIDPGMLYFAEQDGTFDLDRAADFFAVPASELGMSILEAGRLVSRLEIEGDELQDEYMELLDQWWRVDRFCRGNQTRVLFHDALQEKAAEFDMHRTEEKDARVRLYNLLIQFKDGDSSEAVAQPDLSIPEDGGNGESEGYPAG